MSLFLRRQDINPTCPSGGNWYACGSGSNFLGCCNSEPCDHGCPAGNLEPASFNPDAYGKFPDQECPSGSQWYTCSFTVPPFMGCCKTNPCTGTTGCPDGDLTAGFLTSNPKLAAAFISSGGSLAATSSTAVSSGKPTSSSKATATSNGSSRSATGSSTSQTVGSSLETSTAAKAAVNTSAPKTSHTGAIAGGAVGGIAVIAIIVTLSILLYLKRKGPSRKQQPNELDGPSQEKPTPMYHDGVAPELYDHDQKQAASHYSDTKHSTPAPTYPTSSPLPPYPHSPASPAAEMDAQSSYRPQPSPSQSYHHPYSPSSEYANNPLGINTPPQPIMELDSATSPSQSYAHGAAPWRPSAERQDSWELSTSNSVRGKRQRGQSALNNRLPPPPPMG